MRQWRRFDAVTNCYRKKLGGKIFMKRLACYFTVLGLVVFLLFGFAAPGESRDEEVVVIEGGTLIDGNGGTPVTDALVVVRHRVRLLRGRRHLLRPLPRLQGVAPRSDRSAEV